MVSEAQPFETTSSRATGGDSASTCKHPWPSLRIDPFHGLTCSDCNESWNMDATSFVLWRSFADYELQLTTHNDKRLRRIEKTIGSEMRWLPMAIFSFSVVVAVLVYVAYQFISKV